VLGVGSEFGATIPLDGGTLFLADAAGREVVTALDAHPVVGCAWGIVNPAHFRGAADTKAT